MSPSPSHPKLGRLTDACHFYRSISPCLQFATSHPHYLFISLSCLLSKVIRLSLSFLLFPFTFLFVHSSDSFDHLHLLPPNLCVFLSHGDASLGQHQHHSESFLRLLLSPGILFFLCSLSPLWILSVSCLHIILLSLLSSLSCLPFSS